jgi:hypothetical protein
MGAHVRTLAADERGGSFRSENPERAALLAKLPGSFGPSQPASQPPNVAAHALALRELHEAIPRLETFYAAVGMKSLRGGEARVPLEVSLPAARDPLARALADVGFPILGAFSPTSAPYLVWLIDHIWSAAADSRQAAAKRSRRALLTEILFSEHAQWLLIDRVMPYSFRYRAMSWAWSPGAHREKYAYGLCLRCGNVITRSRRPTTDLLLCEHCVKDRHEPWPQNAHCPTRQGRWHLWCVEPGCDAVFEGPGQRRKCAAHQRENQNPTDRSAAGVEARGP